MKSDLQRKIPEHHGCFRCPVYAHAYSHMAIVTCKNIILSFLGVPLGSLCSDALGPGLHSLFLHHLQPDMVDYQALTVTCSFV